MRWARFTGGTIHGETRRFVRQKGSQYHSLFFSQGWGNRAGRAACSRAQHVVVCCVRHSVTHPNERLGTCIVGNGGLWALGYGLWHADS